VAENADIVRSGYEYFNATGDVWDEIAGPGFVWDMSKFEGWPEQPIYEGVEGARTFLRAWTEAWEEWELRLESLHEAGDQVVAIMSQSGRSKATGMTVDMQFAQVWTVRDGKQTRMVMYSDPAEALSAVGLDPGRACRCA
jgi:ketosteroid isomerase-like protein